MPSAFTWQVKIISWHVGVHAAVIRDSSNLLRDDDIVTYITAKRAIGAIVMASRPLDNTLTSVYVIIQDGRQVTDNRWIGTPEWIRRISPLGRVCWFSAGATWTGYVCPAASTTDIYRAVPSCNTCPCGVLHLRYKARKQTKWTQYNFAVVEWYTDCSYGTMKLTLRQRIRIRTHSYITVLIFSCFLSGDT